jgi:hypothetical protein
VRAEVIQAVPLAREPVFAAAIVVEVREIAPAPPLGDLAGGPVPDARTQMQRAIASYASHAELPCPRGLMVRVTA